MRMTWRFDRKRRRFLQKAGAAAAATALGPLLITQRTIAQTRTLYVNSWGGSFTAAQDAAYFKPFTAETGIHIRTVTPVSYAKIKAQVQAGRFEFDMTSINSMQWLRASREGLAEPIDWTIFKKTRCPRRRSSPTVMASPPTFRARICAIAATNSPTAVPGAGSTSGMLSDSPAPAACASTIPRAR